MASCHQSLLFLCSSPTWPALIPTSVILARSSASRTSFARRSKDATSTFSRNLKDNEHIKLRSGALAAQLSVKRRTGVMASGKDLSEFEAEDEGKQMEQYLKSLSLEYDSVWDTKPAWCQPWTIVLTGTTAVAGSWQLLHWPILTGLVSFAISLWWIVFLYLYPQSYTKMIVERRQMEKGTRDS
eukprot:TRINITY_DN29432_c0_g1_i1.p1 TRINITY_DN29432_c0_g1~~TRINITY_DN29432_c0_g1_i1.p1  ORF type:complete len:184 (-),score=17.31 TRINITY_DN29432_c0_g1_i1:349-900(-)